MSNAFYQDYYKTILCKLMCVQSYVDIGHLYNGSNKFTIKSHAQIVRIWQMSVIKEVFLSIS